MSYWKFSGVFNNSPSIAGYTAGQAFDFSLTFVNDEKLLESAYVFVPAQFLNMLEVKLPFESENSYRPVSVAFDGIGSVDDLPLGETEICFRLRNTTNVEIKMLRIPIFVGYADGAVLGITYLWEFKDLLDYVYDTDESGTWEHPDGPAGLEEYGDWRMWADCYINQRAWVEDYGSGRFTCEVDTITEDSFSASSDPAFFLPEGAPFQ